MSVRTETQWLTPRQQQIWRAYVLGSARLNQWLDAQLRPHDLDLAEYEILVQLEEAPDRRLRMSDLATSVQQSRSRLTHTVTRMEQRGLVARSTCPDDRRGVWAELTDDGYQLLRIAAPDHVDSVRDGLVGLASDADFEALGRVFDAVITKVDNT